jgi:pyruvate,water dikinase
MKNLLSFLRGKSPSPATFIVWLDQLPPDSVAVAGGKGASLSRMIAAGLPVPSGFIVTADAFRAFLDQHGGVEVILKSMGKLDVETESTLTEVAAKVREFILAKSLPKKLKETIAQEYARLGSDSLVAVRSSAISEDSQAASFAGQQETFLNIQGADAVARHVQTCWASFFSPSALFYRAKKGSLVETEMAVVVQKMINPDKSGVMFTVDPVQNQRDHVVIEAVYGLGEGAVSGKLTPNQYVLDRKDGSTVRQHTPAQPRAVMYDKITHRTQEVTLSEAQANTPVLAADEVKRLLELGLKVESVYSAPQDIEWCIEGREVYLLQSRPITTL